MWSRIKGLLGENGKPQPTLHSATDFAEAERRLQQGIAQFRNNEIGQAADSFSEAVRLRPDFVEAHNNLGLALRMLGEIQDAEHHYREAVRLAPGNAGAWAGLGDTVTAAGRPGEAPACYHKAAMIEPGNPARHMTLGLALAAGGRPHEAADSYRAAIACDQEHAIAHCNLGLVLAELGEAGPAEAALRRAAALAPENRVIAANLRAVVAGKVQRWHFSMMNDAARNAAYQRAIEQAAPGREVLEIGTGSGLLAMMAAHAGAARVTTCEAVPALADKARQIVAANGMAGRISVIPKMSTALRIPDDLPQRAGLLISEIVASDLVGEGMLPAVEDAKARLLAPNALVIPRAAAILGRLAGSAAIEPYLRVGKVNGFDLSAFNEFTPMTLEPSEFGIEMDAHSDGFEIFDFDFQEQSVFPAGQRRIAVTCTASGVCHGVLQWIRLQLDADTVFENAPGSSGAGNGHWRQTLHAFAEPVSIRKGQVLHLAASHNRENLLFYVEAIE